MRDDNLRITIGKNLRFWRTWRGISQETAAGHLTITLKRLQKYESGGDSPTCDELVAIAAFLQCSVDDLCWEAP